MVEGVLGHQAHLPELCSALLRPDKSPIKCPKCGREHDREVFVKVRRGRASAAATAATAAAAAAAAKLALAKSKKVEDGAIDEDADRSRGR